MVAATRVIYTLTTSNHTNTGTIRKAPRPHQPHLQGGRGNLRQSQRARDVGLTGCGISVGLSLRSLRVYTGLARVQFVGWGMLEACVRSKQRRRQTKCLALVLAQSKQN